MKIQHSQYKYEAGSNKYFFYINCERLDENLEWIISNNIENVKLSQYSGYNLKSIEPILKLKKLKSLSIFVKEIDLSLLKEFRELEKLSIGEKSVNIDVTDLNKLEDLYLVCNKNIKGLNSLKSLKKLILVKAQEDFLLDDNFNSWKNLEDLTLLSPKLPANLNFIKTLHNLKEIEIFSSRSDFDLTDLAFVSENLEILKIGSCKKITGLENVLYKLANLKWLAITDSCKLKNVNFVKKMQDLNTLIILGSSYFEDGDLSLLKDRVKQVSIDNKKHYNLKYEDFQIDI